MNSKKPFPQVYEGEPVEIDPKTDVYFMACCDCNLVHRMRFEIKDGKILIYSWRDNRKTGALRRHRGIPINDPS